MRRFTGMDVEEIRRKRCLMKTWLDGFEEDMKSFDLF